MKLRMTLTLLPSPPECCGYRCVAPHPVCKCWGLNSRFHVCQALYLLNSISSPYLHFQHSQLCPSKADRWGDWLPTSHLPQAVPKAVPQAVPRLCPGCAQAVPRLCPRLCPGCAQAVPKAVPKAVPRLCPRHSWNSRFPTGHPLPALESLPSQVMNLIDFLLPSTKSSKDSPLLTNFLIFIFEPLAFLM